jgi:hypothetical protein
VRWRGRVCGMSPFRAIYFPFFPFIGGGVLAQLPQVTGDGLLSFLVAGTCLVIIANQVMTLIKSVRKPDPSPALHEQFANKADVDKRLAWQDAEIRALNAVQADSRLTALEEDRKVLLSAHNESARNTHDRINELLRAISRVEGMLESKGGRG